RGGSRAWRDYSRPHSSSVPSSSSAIRRLVDAPREDEGTSPVVTLESPGHMATGAADYTARIMADSTIPEKSLVAILDVLDKGNLRVAEQFPGDSPARQPVHVVYGGAHLFKSDAAQKLGGVALRTLQEH